MNLVETQIKQEQEDRKHEEEYAKMELVLQNNLMRTKVCDVIFYFQIWKNDLRTMPRMKLEN